MSRYSWSGLSQMLSCRLDMRYIHFDLLYWCMNRLYMLSGYLHPLCPHKNPQMLLYKMLRYCHLMADSNPCYMVYMLGLMCSLLRLHMRLCSP